MRKLVAAILVCWACSSPVGDAQSAGAATVVPKGLKVRALPGGNGVLEVTALTLRKRDTTSELLAALKNNGNVPACHAAFAVELFDAGEQSLAAGITGLLTQQFYRRTDGSGTIAACVAPGERTLAAITDLPPELVVEDVSVVVYRCPYSALDVERIDGMVVERVEALARGGGIALAGTLVSSFKVSVNRPSVTVFVVDAVGRPLDFAIGTGDVQIPPGGKWDFETSAVEVSGAEYLAYPAGALGN